MKTTKEQLAAQITGREYGEEMTSEEEGQAKESGLVVVFGASDDLLEFRGAINDEAGAYDGGDFYVTPRGLLEAHDDCECKFCGFERQKTNATKIVAVWSKDDYSWQILTDIPHATFEVVEGEEKFCRGIVFDYSELDILTL